MSTSSYGSSSRSPVYSRGARIPNLEQRRTAAGAVVFDWVGRLDGKPVRRRLTAATKTDAILEARALTTDRDRGDVHGSRDVPTVPAVVGEFLEHLESRVGIADERLRRSAGSVNLYRHHLETRFAPAFRTRTVDTVTTADLRRWLDGLRRTGLAPNTLRGILTAAQSTLAYAERQGYATTNPAQGLGRDDRPSSTRKREPRYLDTTQLEKLLGTIGDEYRPAVACLAYAGLRVSEALGLTWGDVDLEGRRLTVSAQLGQDGRRVPAKTRSSVATVEMLPALERELRAHRTRQSAQGIHLVRREALVFQTRTGKPHHRRNALRAVQNAATRAGLGHLTAHDLRHSIVANALHAGLTIPEAARLARHSSPAVTASVYADVLETNRETLGAKLTAAGFGT